MQAERVRPLAPGTLVAGYRILKVLGQGGFGTTYLAEDSGLLKQFALKEFTPHHLVRRQDSHLVVRSVTLENLFAAGLRKFLVEGQRLARLSHPNVVRISRYFEANNSAYLAMDYEKGGSLRSLMHTRKASMTEPEVRAMVHALADGLAQMHRAHLVHRDVKPDNIIIRDDGTPVLIDFGAAIDTGGAAFSHWETIVTPGYAPPEQYRPEGKQGPWTDIYAFGATLYELICGERPPAVRDGIRPEMSPAADLGAGRFSTQLLMLVDRCLEPDIPARPHSLDHFLRHLGSPEDRFTRLTCSNISVKMLVHFMNWARPNAGLYTDEFIIFLVNFPVIDFAWRTGHGLMTRDALNTLTKALDPAEPDRFESRMKGHGFTERRGTLTHSLIQARVDEYSAAYLLDRHDPVWEYHRLCEQVARNCLAPAASHEREDFMSLLREVINRARGRVKEAVRKEWEPYRFSLTESGWQRTLRTDM